jgi:hypothetical protein
MNLIFESYIKNPDGIHEVSIFLEGKPYKYNLKYQQDFDLFHLYYRTGRKGKALNVLKKNNIKIDIVNQVGGK